MRLSNCNIRKPFRRGDVVCSICNSLYMRIVLYDADFIGSGSAPTYGNIPPSFSLTETTVSFRIADQNMGFRYIPADAKKVCVYACISTYTCIDVNMHYCTHVYVHSRVICARHCVCIRARMYLFAHVCLMPVCVLTCANMYANMIRLFYTKIICSASTNTCTCLFLRMPI